MRPSLLSKSRAMILKTWYVKGEYKCLRWKSETGANGTCYWLNLPNDIEVSLFKGKVNNSPYLYSFKLGTDTGMFLSLDRAYER